MRLVLAGVTAALALVVAAPSAAAALPDATALTGTATSAVGAVQQQATGAITGVQQTAQQVDSQANRTVSRTTAEVQRSLPRVQAPKDPASGIRVDVPPARVSTPAASVETPAVHVQTPAVKAPDLPDPRAVAPPSIEKQPTLELGSLLTAIGDQLTAPLGGLHGVGPVDDLTALLGSTLRQLAPLGSLLTPRAPLLGTGPLANLPTLVAVVPGSQNGAPIDLRRVLAATATGPTSHAFQAASARPPAAEVGGRPVSPPPWTAPAPVAGGATAVFSGGSMFVPFLGLLVLAALVMPRLMRRLDELPAFVRPEPFLCALERPG